MHRSRLVVGAVGAVLVVSAGTVAAATRWGGTELASWALAPRTDQWAGDGDVVIPAHEPVVVDVDVDYDYRGDIQLDLAGSLSSDDGATRYVAATTQADDGGYGASAHLRSAPFTLETTSRLHVGLTLVPTGDVEIRSASATVRASPIELGWLAYLLGIPGALALVAAAMSQQIEWRGRARG